MEKIFFDSWESLLRTFIITVLAYASLIIMLRISGKRTLTQMNAFDYIITIALGSAFATVMLNKGVVLADGLLALFLLIGLQFLITWLSCRYPAINDMVTSKPTILLFQGQVDRSALRKQRLTIDELREAARQKGITDLNNVGAIILETAGNMTVLAEVGDNANDILGS